VSESHNEGDQERKQKERQIEKEKRYERRDGGAKRERASARQRVSWEPPVFNPLPRTEFRYSGFHTAVSN
jgi:hypothetical protein